MVVAGTEGTYLWGAVVGGRRGGLFLAVAGDIRCGCWHRGGGVLICRLPSAEFAICFFCVVVWVFVGVGVMVLVECRRQRCP